MKFIEPSITLLEKPEDQTNEAEVLKYIERIGRVCYRSEDKITEDSAKKFFLMLKNRGHWAMLEHFKFTVYVDSTIAEHVFNLNGKTSKFVDLDFDESYHTTEDIPRILSKPSILVLRATFSPRAYLECYHSYKNKIEELREKRGDCKDIKRILDGIDKFNHALWETWPTVFEDIKPDDEPEYTDDVVYIPDKLPEELDRWCSMEFVTSRAVANEIVRHRVASYAQESTRYCNYSKDKFGNELTFIKTEFPGLSASDTNNLYMETLQKIEESYMGMINNGVSPQKARSILPCDLATKIVMTADLSEWTHFLKMRCAPDAHPDIRVLAKKVLDIMSEKFKIPCSGFYSWYDQ